MGAPVAAAPGPARDAGRLLTIRRNTDPAVYPASASVRYSKMQNLETDVDAKVPGLTLVDAKATAGNGAAELTVDPDPAAPAAAPILVDVTFANSAAPAYQPSSYTLTPQGSGWKAALTIHQSLAAAMLGPVLTREFNEIAGRVRSAAAGGGGLIAGDETRAVFVAGPTPPGTRPTAADRASARELKALWDTEKGTTKRMVDALAANGLAQIQTLPPKDAKFAELKGVGFDEPALALLVGREDFEAVVAGNPGVPAQVTFSAALVGHVIRPEYRPNQFPTAGLTGGHLDPALRSFVGAHPELEFVEEASVGAYRKYFQYRRVDDALAGATRPKQGDAAGPPAGWVIAKQTTGAPLPKTTFANTQVFLAEALAAFRSWLDEPGNAATSKLATADFGIKNPAAKSASGQLFGGYFKYSAAKGGQWTLNTIFPIL